MKPEVLPYAIALLLALLPPHFARAEQSAVKAPPADVLFGVYPAQPAAQAFVPVVVQAIRYRLTERGLVAATAEDMKDPGRLDAQARKPGIPIVLSCGISASDTRLLAISLEWRDLQRRGAPVRQDKSGPLDLNLDSVILQAVDSLIGAVSPRVDELVAARAAAARVAQAPAGPPAGGTGAAAGSQGGQSRSGKGESTAPALPPAGGAAGQPATTPAAAAVPAAAAGRPYFVLDTGVAPFVPVGAASLYFPIGVLPSIAGRVVIPTPSGRFAVGLYGAAIYFQASGVADSAQNLLVPAGVDVRYEIGSGAPFLFFAHLAGGPAVLMIASSSQGTLTDLTAFFKSGIGATLMFNPHLGLSLAVDYEIYFEMPYLIMGFAPWVAMSFRM